MAIKTSTYTLNGVTHTLSLNPSNGRYEKRITAPAKSSYSQEGHVYAGNLKVTDQAGNTTVIDKNHAKFGAVMKLRVKETTAPAITVVKPSAGAFLTNNTVAIEFHVTDNDSGVNPNSITLQVDSQAAVAPTKTAIANGYKCTHTLTLADGAHTIKVNASDFDGNASPTKTVSFKVDTVPPILNITNPTGSLITNKQSLVLTGNTNDATSAPCTVTVKRNGADQGAVSVGADGQFSKTLTLSKGTNNIVIRSQDRAGKFSEVTRTVEYDPDAPVIVSVTITPNPVNVEDEILISVEATD